MTPNGNTGASSGGYKVTVQNQVTAVDEHCNGGGVCHVESYFLSTDVTRQSQTGIAPSVYSGSVYTSSNRCTQLLCALQRGKAPTTQCGW